ICDKVMILRRGKVVAFGTMHELRELFGSITYSVFFSAEKPGTLEGRVPEIRSEDGLLVCDAADLAGLNTVSAAITEAGGHIERIESRYPTLEEMLVAVGK
ncbi:MAG: DUF4162 domain-containing protein, partial [Methanoregula sp.]|nr:DUF4162 domain-containing protein [Methanoregula sp.]